MRHLCNRCGYSWVERDGSARKYCPNCYQKDIQVQDTRTKVQLILKKVRKANEKLSSRISGIKEDAYNAWMESQHLLDIGLFIIAIVVIFRVSMYFLVELGA